MLPVLKGVFAALAVIAIVLMLSDMRKPELVILFVGIFILNEVQRKP